MTTERRVRGTPNLYARSYVTARGERRTVYYIRLKDWQGRIQRIPAGDVLATAREQRDDVMRRNLRREPIEPTSAPLVSFSEWANRWLALQKHKKAWPRYELATRPLLAAFGGLDLTALRASHIETYKAQRLQTPIRGGQPPAAATINRELQVLKSLLILAERDGLITKRPHIGQLEEFNTRDRTASAEEYAAIYNQMPIHMRPVLTLLRELGMRVTEAVNLHADQIDRDRRVIVLRSQHTKTKRGRLLPISDIVEHALAAIAPAPDGRLFTHNGKPMTRHHVHDHFQRACAQLGIAGLWVHDLRGTFATEALEKGFDRALVRQITGHASDTAFDRYIRPKLDSLRKVVDKEEKTVH